MKDHKERIEGFTKNFNEALASLYDQGYADASKDVDTKVDDAYERGCDETVTKVWEAGFDDGYGMAWNDADGFMKAFLKLSFKDITEIYGEDTDTCSLLRSYNLRELRNKYYEWAKNKIEHPEFMVGDIVSSWEFGKAVILHRTKGENGEDLFLLCNGTTTNVVTKDRITKIGHSNSVTEMYRDIVKAEDIDNLPF